jgi:hypothetical protein
MKFLDRFAKSPHSGMLAIDLDRSMAQLSGVDWGKIPTDADTQLRARHVFYRTPLKELSHVGFIRLLNIGCDTKYLVPAALYKLRLELDHGELLCSILKADDFDWKMQPDCIQEVRSLVDALDNSIGEITSDILRLSKSEELWRQYAIFERYLAISISQGAPPCP